MLSRIESVFNYVSDRDWAWWPLLRLRPSKTERFSFRLVFALAFSAVAVASTIVLLLRVASHRTPSLEAVVVVSGVAVIGCCAWFGGLAYFWNRRARRLSQGTITAAAK